MQPILGNGRIFMGLCEIWFCVPCPLCPLAANWTPAASCLFAGGAASLAPQHGHSLAPTANGMPPTSPPILSEGELHFTLRKTHAQQMLLC